MSKPVVELVYFEGCPNVERAREELRAVVGDGGWREWNLASPDAPERIRRFGSPSVLVNGRDVAGDEGGNVAMACRADGAPTAEVIRHALDADA